MTLMDRIGHRRHARAAYADDVALVDRITGEWRAVAEVTLGRSLDSPVGHQTASPSLEFVELGPPLVLTIGLLPGQVVEDVAAVASRIAPALGAVALRVEPVGLTRVRITCLTSDPLESTMPFEVADDPGVLILGRDENAETITERIAQLPHVACQGATRSGKSTFIYSTLAQVVRGPAIVAGFDPSGIVGRAFKGTRHAPWWSLGVDPAGVERVSALLLAELDKRLAAMPDDVDVLSISERWPALFVVCEEYTGQLRALDATSKVAADALRGCMARVLAESHKVGMRAIVAAQRFESKAVGAEIKSNCGVRISFRCDSSASIGLLHNDAAELVSLQVNAPAGVALVDLPERVTFRLRAPLVGSYGEYRRLISGA